VAHLSSKRVLLSQNYEAYDARDRAFRADRKIIISSGSSSPSSPQDIDGAPSDGLVSRFALFDRLNRVVGVVNEDNQLEKTEYDRLSRLTKFIDSVGNISQYEYDSGNNLIRVSYIEGTKTFVTTTTYDALGRPIIRTEPNGQQTISAYDSRNNVIRTTDASGSVTEMTYDRYNRMVQKDSILGETTKITARSEFDALGRLVTQTDDNGVKVKYDYDDQNRKTRATYDDNTFEVWTYNALGQAISHPDRNGTTITSTYDNESRLTRETFTFDSTTQLGRKGSTEKTWTYDGLGRLVGTSDNNGTPADTVTCSYEYDSFSNLIKETQRIGTGPILQVCNQWVGRHLKLLTTYPNGRGVSRSYDNAGRLITINDPNNQVIASYSYVGPDRTASAIYGNGTVLTKTYDSNRRATQTVWTKGTNTIASYVNTYDVADRRVSEARAHFGNQVDTYTYDKGHRMTGFRSDGTAVGDSGGGTLTTRVLNGADMMTNLTTSPTSKTLVINDSDKKLNRYTSVDGKTRRYDSNSNLVDLNTNDSNDSADLECAYDYSNRLVEVRNGAGAVLAKYLYDVRGRRVQKTVGTTVTRYLYDEWQVVEERNTADNTVLRQYVDGRDIDEHVQMRTFAGTTSKNYYYHCNDQGFVGALTDDNGAVVEYYKYDWAGKVRVLKPY
jgi:YD repeat-containing protein